MANIVDLLIGLGIDADEYTSGIDQAASKTDSFVSKISGSVGPAIMAGFAAAGAGAAAFAVTSVNAAGDFEASVNNLAAVSGSALADAGFSFDDVSAKALELGQTTAFSASQSIAAMTELVKGGVPIADVMAGATTATLDLAAAGQVELANAAEIVAKQLGVWADHGVTAADVSNLLAQAANASTVGVEELAAGLANAQGTAETAGVEYDDLVQTMALLAPNFASASTAGTSLNNFLLRLQPTTDGATAAMIDLGLASDDGVSKFYDSEGAFIGMEAAAGLLQTSLAGLSEAEKTAALSVIFGNDAMGAAVALGAAGAEGFNNMGAAMLSAGTAADVAAIQNQGFNFALDETLQIIIGTLLLPVLTSFINSAIIPGISAISGFTTALGNGTIPIQTLIGLLTGASPSVTQLTTLISGLSTVFGVQLATQIVTVASGFGSVFSAIQPLIGLIGSNLTPILIGIGAVITGVVMVAIYGMIAAFVAAAAPFVAAAAAAAALYAAYTSNFLGIQTLVNTVVNAVVGFVTGALGAMLSFWQWNGSAIVADAQMKWAAIQAAITNVVNAVSAVVVAIFSALYTFWQNNGASIMTFAMQTWNQISTIVTIAVQLVSAIVTQVFNAVAGFINNHGAQIQSTLTSAWNLISGLISNTLTFIQGVIGLALAVITGDWGGAMENLKTIAGSVLSALQTIFTSGLDTVKGLFNLALEGIRGILQFFVGDANTLGGQIIDGIINGVKSGVGALVDAVKNAANSALEAAKDALGISSPSKEGYYIGNMFMLGPINAIYDMMPSLERAAVSMADTMIDHASATLAPSVNPVGTGAALSSAAAAVGAAGDVLGANAGPTYNITANYPVLENETSLRDTVRQQSILNSPFGA
jgi:TP901 family phage tail tape measure protein